MKIKNKTKRARENIKKAAVAAGLLRQPVSGVGGGSGGRRGSESKAHGATRKKCAARAKYFFLFERARGGPIFSRRAFFIFILGAPRHRPRPPSTGIVCLALTLPCVCERTSGGHLLCFAECGPKRWLLIEIDAGASLRWSYGNRKLYQDRNKSIYMPLYFFFILIASFTNDRPMGRKFIH